VAGATEPAQEPRQTGSDAQNSPGKEPSSHLEMLPGDNLTQPSAFQGGLRWDGKVSGNSCDPFTPAIARLGETLGVSLAPYGFVSVAHALLEALAELFTVYILVVAGTDMLPKRLRFIHYRAWTCAALVLWWGRSGTGAGNVRRWYLVPVLCQ
jgi:hypothetical protein